MGELSTKFATANLPSAAALAETANALRTMPTGVKGGTVLLKMDKEGYWVYGPKPHKDADVEATFAINPFSFTHGFIAWGVGEVLSETMVPVTRPLPEVGPAPQGAKNGWQQNVGCALAQIDGEDAGLQLTYQAATYGGRKAISALATAIAVQLDKDPTKPVPLVKLLSESYLNTKHGSTIWNPIFDIQGWASMDEISNGQDEGDEEDMGDQEPTDEQLVEAVEEKVTTRRRAPAGTKTAAAPVEAAPEPEAEPAAEEPRRRRRPARA